MFGEYNPQGAARNSKQAGESERLSSYKLGDQRVLIWTFSSPAFHTIWGSLKCPRVSPHSTVVIQVILSGSSLLQTYQWQHWKSVRCVNKEIATRKPPCGDQLRLLSHSITIFKSQKDKSCFRSQQKIKDQIKNWLIYLDISAIKVLLLMHHTYSLEITYLLSFSDSPYSGGN